MNSDTVKLVLALIFIFCAVILSLAVVIYPDHTFVYEMGFIAAIGAAFQLLKSTGKKRG